MIRERIPESMKTKRKKINFHEKFELQVDMFGDVIQKEKEINSYDLQSALRLPPTQFYKVQRAGLLKYNKTISYDKKTQVYSYCPFVPLTKHYSEMDMVALDNHKANLENKLYGNQEGLTA